MVNRTYIYVLDKPPKIFSERIHPERWGKKGHVVMHEISISIAFLSVLYGGDSESTVENGSNRASGGELEDEVEAIVNATTQE